MFSFSHLESFGFLSVWARLHTPHLDFSVLQTWLVYRAHHPSFLAMTWKQSFSALLFPLSFSSLLFSVNHPSPLPPPPPFLFLPLATLLFPRAFSSQGPHSLALSLCAVMKISQPAAHNGVLASGEQTPQIRPQAANPVVKPLSTPTFAHSMQIPVLP